VSFLKTSSFGVLSVLSIGLALGSEAIPNWPAPATWSRPGALHRLTTLGDISNPLPFIGVNPCRQYDSRSVTPLPDNTNLAVTLTGAPCGLPSSAQAVSVNITVFDITGAGGNGVFRVGTANDPTTAWINYPSTETQRGNAGVVPVTGSGQIVVKVNQGGGSVDFTVDVNGYYYDGNSTLPLAPGEHFRIIADSGGDSAGIFQNKGTSFATSGVLGFASGTTGTTYGVLGLGVSATAGSVGVRGLQEGTGATYGVQGVTFSTAAGAYGVYGVDGSGDPGETLGGSVGVRGASATGWGVAGFSRDADGVIGIHAGTPGGSGPAGMLGFSSSVGVYFTVGLAGVGTKSFVEPHPTDPSKVIKYVSLEGPEAGTYFRGRARFQRGLATIDPPEDFRIVTDPQSLSIQVTPIGEMASVAVVSIGLDGIVVKASRDVEFFYLVNGVRRAYNNWDPIQENDRFFVPESPAARLPAYLSEEEKARLVANGTYKPDGTVNMETAERLGWTKMWADRETAAAADAAAPTAVAGENR
jgi:hypothetical protein